MSGPLAWVRHVRVGSTNGPKLEAVRTALHSYVADLHIEAVAVDSGVSAQPIGFAEILLGARNRARAAAAIGPCDLAVGIEDGLVELPGVEMEALNIGAAVVTDGVRESAGLSSGFAYPPACLTPALASREPVGDLFDRLWQTSRGEAGTAPQALRQGNIGRLSLGVLPRSEYGRHAVLCALVRFLNPDLYPLPVDPPPRAKDTAHE